MDTQDLGPIVYEVDGPVARIVLNDPARANSQTSEMVHAFDDALTLADGDYAVKVVVIKANGKGFCAGHAALNNGDLLVISGTDRGRTGEQLSARFDYLHRQWITSSMQSGSS